MAEPVLIGGTWRDSEGTETFQAESPAAMQKLPEVFPVSPRAEIEAALTHASEASEQMEDWPGERFAGFLEVYAGLIELSAKKIVNTAHDETALPEKPRLEGELQRTIDQLRQAAAAARDGSWKEPIVNKAKNIRSIRLPIGPVAVYDPTNFPLAFNSSSGGDAAAAFAAGNPVFAKGHPCHPHTTKLLAECALQAAKQTGMPDGFVQLIYHMSPEDGFHLVSHPQIGASAYTGSRHAGLKLKAAAEAGGKPIYLELSSINPVFLLQGALRERLAGIVDDFVKSSLMGVGQLCTNPGLVVLPKGEYADGFLAGVRKRFEDEPIGTLLSRGVQDGFMKNLEILKSAGAEVVTGGTAGGGTGYSCANTLLQVKGDKFLAKSKELQTEVFGPSSLLVFADDADQMVEIARAIEGNLTNTIYDSEDGTDKAAYDRIKPVIRRKLGRLVGRKMPTGVLVVDGMQHGGPAFATGHPEFTSVGIPRSLRRFAPPICFDNVPQDQLPLALRD